METEQARLQKLYHEMSDDHLLDLADDADDLTDEARLVLANELRERGLTPAPHAAAQPIVAAGDEPVEETVEPEREEGFGAGVPGMFPGGAAAMEQALEAPRTRKDGLTTLISFYDGMQLGKACEILEADNIHPVIEPIAGDALSGVPARFEVWLDKGQIERAQVLLRLKMGLFPSAEVDKEDEGAEPESGDGVVAMFETASEAEEARAMLANAGIEGTVKRFADEDSDAVTWELSVDPTEQERAIGVVAAGMGLG
jgi:hypothetical protein